MTTTAPDILAKLRVAWTASTPDIAPPAADSPRLLRLATDATCNHGIDRSSWTDSPAPDRPGWIRTTCSACGGFVGYRPIPEPPKRKRKTKQ